MKSYFLGGPMHGTPVPKIAAHTFTALDEGFHEILYRREKLAIPGISARAGWETVSRVGIVRYVWIVPGYHGIIQEAFDRFNNASKRLLRATGNEIYDAAIAFSWEFDRLDKVLDGKA